MAKRAKKDGVDVLLEKQKKAARDAVKAPKQAKAAKPPKAAKAGKGHNQPDEDQRRALFLNDLAKRKRLLEAKDAAVAALRNHAKSVKADGNHTIKQLDIAIRMQTPDGEAAVRELIAGHITAAKWIGSPIGTQFAFDLDDRTPAVDRARDEGKQASMQNQPCKPGYDPSTPQYAAYMEGYQEDQVRIASGIKPLDDDEGGDGEDDGDPDDETESSGWGKSRERDPARPLDS